MEQQSSGSKNSCRQNTSQKSDRKSNQISKNLFSLFGESSSPSFNCKIHFNARKSIGSGKSSQSRDSDLLNRLAKQPSKPSSKSLSRNVSFQYLANDNQYKSQMNSSKSNSIISGSECSLKQSTGKGNKQQKNCYKFIQTEKMAPKIHNCVCMVAGQCLGYNCNCFLSPYPCAPDCCSNCLNLKSGLPLIVSNVCSCKKTRCLKLYCECLSKGLYCNPLCQCNLCENHEHSVSRIESIHYYQMYKGCSCQKSHCKKKYCDCFAQGLKCTNKCICIDCHNFLQPKQKSFEKMEQELEIDQQNQKIHDQKQKVEEDLQFQKIDFFGFQNRKKK